MLSACNSPGGPSPCMHFPCSRLLPALRNTTPKKPVLARPTSVSRSAFCPPARSTRLTMSQRERSQIQKVRSSPQIMRSSFKLLCAALLFLFAAAISGAQDLVIGPTYVCNGEHIYIEACNIRDTSDTSLCMVAHPDHLTPTGINSYTNVSRGDLKKLLPTCQQPTPQQIAAAKAFQKKQADLYNANVQKANEQMKAYEQQANSNGQPTKPKTPEERALARCITSGRLAASCTGN